MTATSLTPVDLVEALITKLTGDATLLATLPGGTSDEIREEHWQGTDFAYPNVRLGVNFMNTNAINGQCHGQWFDFSASAYVFSEGESSKECQTIMGVIGRLFLLATVSSAALRTQPLDVDYVPPIAEDIKLWRGEVLITGRVKELV